MYTPSKELCEPFILTEQHIRRIVEIIENRRPEGADYKYNPTYTYKRLDSYERETADINDIFKEDNCGETRIVNLKISSLWYSIADSGLNYEVEFSSCENSEDLDLGLSFFKSITFGVKGEDRDVAELFFNDLDSYIRNTIISKKHRKIIKLLRKTTSLTVLMFFPIVLSIISLLQSLFVSTQDDTRLMIENAISSADISQKLDTLLLLQQRSHTVNIGILTPSLVGILILILILIVVSAFMFNEKIKKKFYSCLPFVFDFGVSPEDYRLRFRAVKTVIGMIGTLLLGLLGNCLYNMITRFFGV